MSSRRDCWTGVADEFSTSFLPAGPLKDGNYIISGTTPEIIVKEHYWTQPATGVAGNAIDFLVKIRGVTFNQAIRLLLPDTAGHVQLLREPGAS